MHELDDTALLREYVARDSGEAFAEIVARHVSKVYSVALRHTGNPHSAEEITQAVFVILARKSPHLSRRVILSGWLYQTARLTAVTFLRSEIRRARREQESHMQTSLNKNETETWTQIAPLLDAAMAGLNETDRAAVVLRFFDGKSMGEVGAALGANEDAAKKRVNRALEKLRKFFTKHGVSSTTAILAGTITANSVQAAPVALAKSVTAVAIAKGAAASGSTLTLIKGALKIMAWTKAKTVIVTGAVVLFAIGTTTVTVKEIQEHRTYPWQIGNFDELVLNEQSPQVRLLLSKLKAVGSGTVWDKNNHFTSKTMGLDVSAEQVIAAAYRFYNPARTVILTELPKGRYDYIACFTFPVGVIDGNEKALQQLVKRKFGVIAKVETRDTDAFFLEVQNANAPNLKQFAVPPGEETFQDGRGAWSGKNVSIANFTTYLEQNLGTPIFD